jgi:AcrR family transcriptional regulator
MATNITPAVRPARAHQNEGVIDRVAARIAAGETVKAACDALGVAVPTYYRWRATTRRGIDARASGDSRDMIMDAAKKLFLREGFGVSMNRIAETAGVARQTLFNRFGNKERLFREVVHRIFERMMQALMNIEPNRDLAATLTVYAHQYLDVAFDPEGIALHRLTISEVREFPDLAKLVQSLGVSRAVPVLADYLRDRMAANEIRQCDPEITAECFLASVTGHSRHRAMMGTETDSRARIEARLRVSVDMFVRGLQKH